MKWSFDEPYFGAPVRVKLGEIYHYGIYVSEDEIIQFGLPPVNFKFVQSDVKVLTSDEAVFTAGGFLEVGFLDKKEAKKARSFTDVVNFARSKIGVDGYDILHNNCEHFCYECLFNEAKSTQIDAVKDAFKNRPYVYVYLSTFPFDTDKSIYPKERKKEIDAVTNLKVKEEKFYVWKLLEKILCDKKDLPIKKVKFSKQNAKWVADGFNFSLTHSKNVLAVAVAKNPVGVDIEFLDDERFFYLKDKILTDSEISEYSALPDCDKADYLARLWTVKESIFKMKNGDVFKPSLIESNVNTFISKKYIVNDKPFYLSISCKDAKISLIDTFGDIHNL